MVNYNPLYISLRENRVPKNENGTYKIRLRKGTIGLDNKDPTLIAMMGGFLSSDFCKNTNNALRTFYVGLVDVSAYLNLSRNKLITIKKDFECRLSYVHKKQNTTLLLDYLANICYINNLLA